MATATAVCAPLQLMLTESMEKPRPETVCTWEHVRVSIMSKLPAHVQLWYIHNYNYYHAHKNKALLSTRSAQGEHYHDY